MNEDLQLTLNEELNHDDASVRVKRNERSRWNALRVYIERLSVKPRGPLELLEAVANDLEIISNSYDGNFDKAIKSSTKGAAYRFVKGGGKRDVN